MANTYRVLLPLQIDGHQQGDVFEHAFTEDEEKGALDSGLLEIVPRPYKVIGDSRVFEHEKGETLEAALTIGQEAALIAGGHIKRVKAETADPTQTTKGKK